MTDPAPASAPASTPDPASAATPDPTPAATPDPTPPASPLDRNPSPPKNHNLPQWLNELPDTFQQDATLSRYASIEDLAKGHLETQKLARSKVILPNEDDPDSFNRFAAAIRPEKADDYAIEVGEGQSRDFADAMRPVFHDAGLHPKQVERLVKANNKFVETEQARLAQKGRDEIDALKTEMGETDYAISEQATKQWLDRMGIPIDFENDLSRMVGTGNTLRLLFDLVGRTGELGKITADDISLSLGSMNAEQAMEAARMLQNDPANADALKNQNSDVYKRYTALKKLAAKR